MSIPETRPAVAFVTASDHKFRAVAESLPDHVVFRVPPAGPDEQSLSAHLPFDELRSAWVSKAKEQHWAPELPGVAVVLFNDVTRIAGDMIFEKPGSREEMIDQIMKHSGKNFIIRASYTARLLGHDLRTVIVDSVFRARRFNYKEVKHFMSEGGSETAMNTAGSLPIEWVVFLDRRNDVERRFTDLETRRTVLFERVGWDSVDASAHRALITGAHPVPFRHLVNSVQ